MNITDGFIKLYKIDCSTGCSCCSGDNHKRGYYKSKEIAQKRIDYFKSPDSKFWPVASQYSKRGNYHIYEVNVEVLVDGRYIIDGHLVTEEINIIEPKEDGSLTDNDIEVLYEG
jgi:hypothetical protein